MSREDIPNVLIRLTNVTGFDHAQEANLAFKEATEEIERLLAQEREAWAKCSVCVEHKACEDTYIKELEALRATVQRNSFELESEREKAAQFEWNLAHEPAKCGHARANWKDPQWGTPEYKGHERCEACQAIAAEREKVREMCAVVCDDMDGWRSWVGIPGFTGAPTEADAAAGYLADKIRQLDFTKDLAPSTEEDGPAPRGRRSLDRPHN